MALLPDVFKSKDHKAMDDFSPVPAGDYKAQIIESEMKENSSGTGSYLKLKIKILDGDEANRILFEYLNLVHTNSTAVEIAQKALKSICDAVGVVTVKDSMELHGKPMMITVKVTEGDEKYGPGNSISNYKPLSGVKKASPFK